MYQIDNPTAATTRPAVTPAGATGYFTDGDAALAHQPTILPAEWLNMLQDELINILTAAGITPDKTKFNQLALALQTGVAATPPQFDNSTKPATTAFVQRALGSYARAVGMGANHTYTAADIGSFINIASVAGTTQTLPLGNGLPLGSAITFRATVSGQSFVARQGTDTFSVNGSTLTSLTLNAGDDATFVLIASAASSVWLVLGSAALVGAGVFAANPVANGYQKLPSGLLVQWGLGTGGSATYATINYPVAFPNAVFSVTATAMNTAAYTATLQAAPTRTNFTISTWSVGSTPGQFPASFYYVATGN
jgi:hypothetical protein